MNPSHFRLERLVPLTGAILLGFGALACGAEAAGDAGSLASEQKSVRRIEIPIHKEKVSFVIDHVKEKKIWGDFQLFVQPVEIATESDSKTYVRKVMGPGNSVVPENPTIGHEDADPAEGVRGVIASNQLAALTWQNDSNYWFNYGYRDWRIDYEDGRIVTWDVSAYSPEDMNKKFYAFVEDESAADRYGAPYRLKEFAPVGGLDALFVDYRDEDGDEGLYIYTEGHGLKTTDRGIMVLFRDSADGPGPEKVLADGKLLPRNYDIRKALDDARVRVDQDRFKGARESAPWTQFFPNAPALIVSNLLVGREIHPK